MRINSVMGNNPDLMLQRTGKINNSDMRHAPIAKSQDSFLNNFWNITDSMDIENQIEFTATVLANRVFSQGFTEENQNFIKNISGRFSQSNINRLYESVMNNPEIQAHDPKAVSDFMTRLKDLVNSMHDTAKTPLKQSKPAFQGMRLKDIFFQTSMLKNQGTEIRG
ncbi:MAG: hypothetical protein GX221_09745 [Candidatus Riflebacteria bacterium]|nr:hypothetical protein [Candidatus Riflebacteria bacterium]